MVALNGGLRQSWGMSQRARGPVFLWHGGGRQPAEPAWGRYADEVLAHAGVTATECSRVTDLHERGVVVVTGQVGEAEQALLRAWVEAGGVLLLTQGPGGLADLAGVAVGAPVGSEVVTLAEGDPWTHVPPRPIRALGGHALDVRDAEALAQLPDGAALTRRRVGDGLVLCAGVDLWFTIARIQQGSEVVRDGAPAADGTAPIDDGILKAEDGMALRMDADRALPPGAPDLPADYTHTYPPPAIVPMFDQPVADWWRSVFLQLLWHGLDHAGERLAWLDYWPAGVDTVAHMSHDADGNVPDEGVAALEAFADAGVHVTWHQVFPGGYGAEIFARVGTEGHEQALHYNAMHDTEISEWGWAQFEAQYRWAQAATGCRDIVSNKNHYTRWEGWTEFYTWCERVGIRIDSSRGPSKQGDVGFPFGTAHVSFPLTPAEDERDVHDVLNLPLNTQDLGWAGHLAVRDVILDGAQAHHGVAHFLFHGPHLLIRPITRQACLDVADEARRRGMPWWTAGQIDAWERARRGVSVWLESDGDATVLRTASERPLAGAAVVVPWDGPEPEADGVRVRRVQRHGRDFLELGVDIPAGRGSWRL